jgi:hypothetical protein
VLSYCVVLYYGVLCTPRDLVYSFESIVRLLSVNILITHKMSVLLRAYINVLNKHPFKTQALTTGLFICLSN